MDVLGCDILTHGHVLSNLPFRCDLRLLSDNVDYDDSDVADDADDAEDGDDDGGDGDDDDDGDDVALYNSWAAPR